MLMEPRGNKRMVPMAIVLALVMLTFMATAPKLTLGVKVVIECSQPDCQNKCVAAYGSTLIRSACEKDPLPFGGSLCVCYHSPATTRSTIP
ncbi:hypothetical protein REPUB_Repub03eG0189200 [Reevesia pubescens]